MPLHIAMIGHKRIPSRESGIEIVVEQLSARLVKQGHIVDVYNRKNKNSITEKNYKGINIITIPTIDKKSLDAPVYAVLATIRACFGNYDVLHYHAEGPCIALWLCKLFKKRIVVTIHGLDWQRAKWGGLAAKVIKYGERNAVWYADRIIVLSKNIQKYFLDEYGRETVFIPNGIEKPENRSDRTIAEAWGLKKDNYLLFLGRIVPEKGLDYLIEAYKEIITEMPLVIAGGSSHTYTYYQELQKKASGDRRIIFTGHVEGEKLESLYSNAYIYILPSDLEGMPISLLEAMSYGNCCLVSDIPENTEVVEDKAVTFSHGNTADLREKLRQLLADDKLVNDYKDKASDYITEKYDWDSVVKKTLKIYER